MLMEGRVGTDIGIKIVNCDAGVSLHSKTHPSTAIAKGTVLCIPVPKLDPVINQLICT